MVWDIESLGGRRESKIQAEMQRLLREQAIASLKAKGINELSNN